MAPAAGLASLLDGDDSARGPGDEAIERLERAEIARAQAESDAAEGARRLEVARQQFAEYATSKADEAKAMGAKIRALLASSSGAPAAAHTASAPEAAEDPAAVLASLARLAADAEVEAAAMAATAMEEVNKRKRKDDDDDDAAIIAAAAASADPSSGPSAGPSDVTMTDPSAEADHPDAPAAFSASSPSASSALSADDASSFAERAKYIPLRLDAEERKLLRLLEAALHVSEYTDKVDIMTFRSKTQRITKQLREICAIMSGLVVATDYRRGQELIADKTFSDNASFFQTAFEIGRRHKVMNPDKMRSEYGKMIYLLQDSQTEEVTELLEFKLVKPMRTAWSLLREKGGLAMLDDGLMAQATAEIMHEGKPRAEVQREIRAKEKAREHLARKYQTAALSSEDILLTLYSIGDNNAYLRFNRDPVDRVLGYLTQYFDPKRPESPEFSLGISVGMGGARLSHNHERQFTYVQQSMTLWREVSNDMFKLWSTAESDLLREGGRYQLTNTGQGLNRVQSAPRTNKAIHEVLARCQAKLGGWVGSGVVHLGDHNVPNALMFIDKYTQVPRILNPVALVISSLDDLVKNDDGLREYVERSFGGVERCRKTILCDFFRHAFDGSGADNFFDAGSCIDGRLTSCWNWANKIEKKAYYPVFKLAGFTGFDGDFR